MATVYESIEALVKAQWRNALAVILVLLVLALAGVVTWVPGIKNPGFIENYGIPTFTVTAMLAGGVAWGLALCSENKVCIPVIGNCKKSKSIE